MKRSRFPQFIAVLFLLLVPTLSAQSWTEVESGVWYADFSSSTRAIHVTRVDLSNSTLDVIASAEIDRGLTVDEFAARYGTIVAINADYFNQQMEPIGPARSSCGTWGSAGAGRTEIIVALGSGRAEIYRPSSRDAALPSWVEDAVAGWPMLVDGCRSLAGELPGSQAFTGSPHPRTAVGLSRDGKTMYFVAVDGRLEGIPGLTLPQLAEFMREELGVCTAVNLDGGGSTHMVIDDETVNRPSDGDPRRVANHLAVVPASLQLDCTIREGRASAGSMAIKGTWARVEALEKKIAAGTANRDERIELARLYLDRGRFWEAKKIADAILATGTEDRAERIRDEAQLGLLRTSSDKGEVSGDAKTEVAATTDPLGRARELIERERYWEAKEIAEANLTSDRAAEARAIIAEAESGLERLRQAELVAARQAASDGSLESRIQLADLLFRDGQYDEAIEIYESVPEDRRTPEIRLRHARALSWSGRLDRAERIYHALLREQPSPEIRLEYGRLLSWMGATRTAENHLRELYDDRSSDEVVIALANALSWQGRRTDAVALLERHVAAHGPGEAAARLEELRESPELRLERYDRAIAAEPYNLSLRIARARLLIETGRYSRAIEDLDFVDRHSPREHEEIDSLLAEARQRRDAEIASLEDQVTNVDPDRIEEPERLLALAREASGLSRYRDAADLYEAYLERVPDDLEARVDYARVLSWDSRYGEATRVYESILAEHPDRLDLRLEYARILSWDERYRRAVAELRDLQDISDHPRSHLYVDVPAEASFSLGQIYRWFGWHEHAIEQQQYALGLDGGFEPAAEELEIVRHLRPASSYDGRYTHAETASDFTMDRVDFVTEQWISRDTALEGLAGWHQFRQAGSQAEALSIGAGVRHRFEDQWSGRARLGINRYDDDTRWFASIGAEWMPSLSSRVAAEIARYDLIYDVHTLRSLENDPLAITDLSLHYDHDTGGRWAWSADASFGDITDDNQRLALHGLLSFELFNDPFVAIKADYRHLEYDFRSNRYWSPQEYDSLAAVLHIGDNVREKFFWDAELKYGRSWQEDDSHDLQAISLRGTIPITERIDLVAAYAYGRSGRIDEPFASPDLVTYWQRRWYVGFRLRNLFRGGDRNPERRYYFDDRALGQDPALPQFGEEL